MANTFDSEVETPDLETLAGLAENLVYRLPGCSDLMVRKAIQAVYRDFCRRSCCLRVRRQFRQEPDRCEYPACSVYGGMVDQIVEVSIGRRVLRDGHDYCVRGPVVVLNRKLNVRNDVPEESRPVITITHVEIPDIGQESAPKWFIMKYGDAICSGAISRLMSMTGRPWSDLSQAQQEMIAYENFVNEARVRYYAGSDSGDGNTGPAFDTSDLV